MSEQITPTSTDEANNPVFGTASSEYPNVTQIDAASLTKHIASVKDCLDRHQAIQALYNEPDEYYMKCVETMKIEDEIQLLMFPNGTRFLQLLPTSRPELAEARTIFADSTASQNSIAYKVSALDTNVTDIWMQVIKGCSSLNVKYDPDSVMRDLYDNTMEALGFDIELRIHFVKESFKMTGLHGLNTDHDGVITSTTMDSTDISLLQFRAWADKFEYFDKKLNGIYGYHRQSGNEYNHPYFQNVFKWSEHASTMQLPEMIPEEKRTELRATTTVYDFSAKLMNYVARRHRETNLAKIGNMSQLFLPSPKTGMTLVTTKGSKTTPKGGGGGGGAAAPAGEPSKAKPQCYLETQEREKAVKEGKDIDSAGCYRSKCNFTHQHDHGVQFSNKAKGKRTFTKRGKCYHGSMCTKGDCEYAHPEDYKSNRGNLEDSHRELAKRLKTLEATAVTSKSVANQITHAVAPFQRCKCDEFGGSNEDNHSRSSCSFIDDKVAHLY